MVKITKYLAYTLLIFFFTYKAHSIESAAHKVEVSKCFGILMTIHNNSFDDVNRIKAKKSDLGVLVCGSGTGMAISANKIKFIRAAVCYNAKSTRLSRQHNNANIIALGARLTNKKLSFKLVEIFLKL